MGCSLRSTSGPSERDEGEAEDFGELGRKRKGKRKFFSFSDNIFVKKNNLEIAR
jgi:hypothetical protein